jgi:hypothetical protein
MSWPSWAAGDEIPQISSWCMGRDGVGADSFTWFFKVVFHESVWTTDTKRNETSMWKRDGGPVGLDRLTFR